MLSIRNCFVYIHRCGRVFYFRAGYRRGIPHAMIHSFLFGNVFITNFDVRYANHPDSRRYDTAELRRHYHISRVFEADCINLTYSHQDRIIAGGIMPVEGDLVPESCKELAAPYFLARRELGAINVGGDGVMILDGVEYPVKNRDGIYVGMGTRELVFRSLDKANPAKFYINSCPAHRTCPTVLIPMTLVFLFWRYFPMYALLRCFKVSDQVKPVSEQLFSGFSYFKRLLFSGDSLSTQFWRALRNTFLLSFYGLVFGFPVPVLWAFQQFTSLGAEAVGMTMMVSNVSTGIAAIAIAIPVVRRILKLSREEELPQPFIKEEPQ